MEAATVDGHPPLAAHREQQRFHVKWRYGSAPRSDRERLNQQDYAYRHVRLPFTHRSPAYG